MLEDWAVTGVPAQPGCGCWDAPGVRQRLRLRLKRQGPSPRPQPQSPITGACKVSDPAYYRVFWTGSGGRRSPESEPASPPVRHIA